MTEPTYGGPPNLTVAFVLDPHYSSHNPRSRKDDFPTAMLKKTEWLAEQSWKRHWDKFVIAGDIFSTAILSYGYLVRLSHALKTFRSSCRRYAVVGNHDLKHRRIDSIPEQPIGVLFEMGALEDLTQAEDTAPLVGMHYYDQPEEHLPTPVEWEGHKWLVCHQYVGARPGGFEADALGWLLYKYIDALGYTGVVAGHDHMEYADDMTKHGAQVYRFGALSRGTKHEHNRIRTPKVLEVTFYPEGKLETTKLEVPVQEDVFLASEIMATARNTELKGFVQALGQDAFAVGTQDDMTTEDYLKDIIKAKDFHPDVGKMVREYLEMHGVI